MDGAEEEDRSRAVSAWRALEALRDGHSGLYLEPRRGGPLEPLLPARLRASSVWPFANAWAATLELASLQQARLPPGASGTASGGSWEALLGAHVEAIAAYGSRRGSRRLLEAEGPLRLTAGAWQPPGTGGEAYYDDNAWIALDLLAQHRLTGDERLLTLAGRVLSFVLSGWSNEEGWVHPGGIRWAEPAWSRSRNACSNGPAAEAAALLAAATGDGELLGWALRITGWLEEALIGGSGLVEDRLEPDGTVRAERYTYNQGTAIGALVLCFEATGDGRHLEQARRVAQAAERWLSSGEVLARQPPEFNAIYLRNLGRLAAHADVSRNLAAVRAWADRAWSAERDPATGLFGAGKPSVNSTAGMTSVYCLLAGAAPIP